MLGIYYVITLYLTRINADRMYPILDGLGALEVLE
jgi:hypothetical protein